MNLLHRPESAGYPTEYLIARIRGRRVYLVKDWNTMLFSPNPLEILLRTNYRELVTEYSKEGVWKHRLKEFQWVYLQMNKGLRNIFYPFFLYSEVKTIIFCLRYKIEKETNTDVGHLLSFSLLSKEAKEILKREADLPFLLEAFQRKFFVDIKRELKEIFLEEGLKGVEEELANGFMKQIIGLRLHPLLKDFFVYLIDIKNIITVYKHVRWSVKTEPVFMQEGGIKESNLRKSLQDRALFGVTRLMYELTGVRVQEPSASTLENTLYTGLTKKIRTVGRESYDIGLILDYLWKICIETQNLSILLYGGDIEREYLRKEMVI